MMPRLALKNTLAVRSNNPLRHATGPRDGWLVENSYAISRSNGAKRGDDLHAAAEVLSAEPWVHS
ncbi:hypothetical protein Pla52n_04750 [Stieleria varia]|uniref:Uncharacterized protein n=1 Tax=Stieleria varia TaxID=2528005 RepID=A0A5C6B9A8_9BACT|nr:hypothetical protein Pla52n_04750 [Stieleria varia]